MIPRNRNKLWSNAFQMRYLNVRIEGLKHKDGGYNIWFTKARPRIVDDHPGKGWKGFTKVVFRTKIIYTVFEIALSMEAIHVMFSGITQLEKHINQLQCQEVPATKPVD